MKAARCIAARIRVVPLRLAHVRPTRALASAPPRPAAASARVSTQRRWLSTAAIAAATGVALAGVASWTLDERAHAAAAQQSQPHPAAGSAVPAHHAAALGELRALFGERFSDDEADRAAHAADANSYHAAVPPFAVIHPKSTEEVSKALQICSRYALPVVAYGSGTSLEGHTTVPTGGVTMSFSEMTAIKSVNASDMDCVVEPGITWTALNEALKPHGLFFPVDPGPGASIGGMVATGCSGTNAVRYGTMKDNVLNLTVVLADGRVIKTGQRARKSRAGYDLTRLFVGSEGTLGVVTEATLKLTNLPASTAVATCHFPSVKLASEAVIRMMQRGVRVQCVELLDETMMQAVNKDRGMNHALKPTLFLKFSGSEAQVRDEIATVGDIVKGYEAGPFNFAVDAEAQEKLWLARKGALWSAAVLKPGTQPWTTDVCVPISRLAECIEETRKDLNASFLPAPIVGHVGDGNFHVILMVDPKSPRDLAEAKRLNSRMIERAIAMDGTCSGEHGVGIGKREYVVKELGADTVDAMRAIKLALDPQGLLNPGKVFELRRPS